MNTLCTKILNCVMLLFYLENAIHLNCKTIIYQPQEVSGMICFWTAKVVRAVVLFLGNTCLQSTSGVSTLFNSTARLYHMLRNLKFLPRQFVKYGPKYPHGFWSVRLKTLEEHVMLVFLETIWEFTMVVKLLDVFLFWQFMHY